MSKAEMFKTAVMGGFDKDDVMEQFQILQDKAADEKVKLEQQIQEKEEKIKELEKRLQLKELHQTELENGLKEKYQKYVDEYDSIASLVFDAKVRARRMLDDAKEQCEHMKRETQAECNAMIKKAESDSVKAARQKQFEIEEKVREGKKNYQAVQKELAEIVNLINQAQHRFMSSYKEVHRIIGSMPSSLEDLSEEIDEI
ncbi:hypothetical protein B5F53_03320 [Blautia sp. An249]|uniref:hypothetical protein n=1 Tax=Blautia sp. An249 TaxID=1965603 RepID=UPI000B3AF81A|nr:hypothetical protein [Blautia sp. An249]OUO80752.1 hypothetical protein B5F53_03320 [Blautia sp. An249]